tara:strand:+ start:134 stop:859 length:726 start_codon:yes stop_codon:yes gene_type:complete
MFNKYQQLGAYHWKDIDTSSFYKILTRSISLYTRYQKCLKYIQKKAGSCIEIGCGDGALSYLIATKGIRVLGCDTDQTGIDLAIKQVKGLPFSNLVQFKCCNFLDVNIDPESVDVIILADVIEHLEEPLTILQEIKRLGKPGGQLIITTPVEREIGSQDSNHVCEYTEESLKLLLMEIFPSTVVKPFTPLIFHDLCNKYSLSFMFRYLFNTFSIIGINPFSISLPYSKHVMLCSISCFQKT